ncbi:hypothetical protein DL768_001005 [Monosporascus sp. mg162]|nr:hypothetical protein DL768_001005 [Monosporascus sp. mg162]
MAITETASPSNSPNATTDMTDRQERPGRRRPFSNWVKKLASFKTSSSSSEGGRNGHFRRDHNQKSSKKRPSKNNNPYPQSGRIDVAPPVQYSDPSLAAPQTGQTSDPSVIQSRTSLRSSGEEGAPHTAGAMSVAPTVSTDHEATHSINAPSHVASSLAGTSRTANGGFESRKGGDSTFSSPAPSVRSLTTTLTTIQSMGPNGALNMNMNGGQRSHLNPHHSSTTQSIQFSQPFPTSSPASAIPPHLAPFSATGHPTTYNTATANNLLTDNASILTLASSSKRRRRRSMDTDASVRALAPSSLWGGSRESLPLSVLSANVDGGGSSVRIAGPTTVADRSAAANERTSIYSATGIAPAEQRSSYYAAKDGASIRSGLLGHGRADSITGSAAAVGSPLAPSPREVSEETKEEEREKAKSSAEAAR